MPLAATGKHRPVSRHQAMLAIVSIAQPIGPLLWNDPFAHDHRWRLRAGRTARWRL
jgi:hypothetical protein